MALRKLGRNTRLYRNSGTAESPTWSRLSRRQTGTFNQSAVEDDATGEDSGSEEETQVVMISRSLDVDIFEAVETDADFAALESAFDAMDVVEIAIANGDITTNGTKYRKLSTQITQFNEDHNVKNIKKASLTFKKCPGTPTTTVTVSGGG